MRPTPKAGDAVLWGGVLDEGVGPPKIGRSLTPSCGNGLGHDGPPGC
jgi:hypothetical protein